MSGRDSDATKAKKTRVAASLRKLKTSLGKHIAMSRGSIDEGETMKLAAWNLREFGGSNCKGRSFEELYYIAEIISCFNIIAKASDHLVMWAELKTDFGDEYLKSIQEPGD